MDPLKLLITDTSFLLSRKGEMIAHEIFATDDECFEKIKNALASHKNTSLICYFSGSRVKTSGKTIHYEQKTPFSADKELLETLVYQAKDAFLKEHSEEVYELCDSSVRNIRLNDYPVTELQKTKALDLKVNIFLVAIGKKYLFSLKQALKPFKENAVTYRAFAESLASRAEALTHKNDFMVCSAYERSTDIAVHKIGNFFALTTVPLGTHHVLEHLAKGLSLTMEQAEEQLLAYNEGHLDVALSTKVDEALLSFQISFDNEVKKALTFLSAGISLPSQVFLLASPFFRKAFDAAFVSDSYHAHVFSEKGFEVTNMSSILTS